MHSLIEVGTTASGGRFGKGAVSVRAILATLDALRYGLSIRPGARALKRNRFMKVRCAYESAVLLIHVEHVGSREPMASSTELVVCVCE